MCPFMGSRSRASKINEARSPTGAILLEHKSNGIVALVPAPSLRMRGSSEETRHEIAGGPPPLTELVHRGRETARLLGARAHDDGEEIEPDEVPSATGSVKNVQKPDVV